MMSHALSEKAKVFVAKRHQMLIGGQWLEADSGKTMNFRNPATGEVIGTVPAASEQDVDRAVSAARAAFEHSAWSAMRPVERQRLLLRLADLVERDAQVLAELECLNNGKSLAAAREVDVPLCIDFLRYMAGWATKIEGSTISVSLPTSADGVYHGYTQREPVGVVGAVVAWNFPLVLACWKLAPALATGCTMVFKPADETPLTALKLAELLLEAGYPPGVFNLVTGTGLEVGAPLTRHPGIDKITFTGSYETGKAIGKAALENMTRLTLELGGKSPTIVLPDANLEEAAAGAANAIFFNQGQVCCAGSRLYVHRKHFDRVVEQVACIANDMVIGNGFAPNTQIGPLISARQQNRVIDYVHQGRSEGASILCGGETLGPGYFMRPTVMVGARQSDTIVQEEIFGPVLVAIPFDDVNEVVKLANDNVYGLGASIWSNDLAAVHRMIPKIKSGSVWVNCHTALDPALPFGGYKRSGLGREMGAAVVEQYTETKAVLIKA